MDKDVLIHEMTERFQELYAQALEVLEDAPDGEWISASEHAFRDVFRKLMTESYETALKNKVAHHPTAHQAAFPLGTIQPFVFVTKDAIPSPS